MNSILMLLRGSVKVGVIVGLHLQLLSLPAFASSPVLPAPAPKGEQMELDDISLYVEESGHGQPVIFLHGGMGSANAWSHQVPVFAKNYRVITPDSRGQGRSGDGKGPLTYHVMAEDIVRLMDKLHIAAAFIVGWSDGGNIGIDMAIHHPERIKALVAYGANINTAGLQRQFFNYIRDVSLENMQKDIGGEFLELSPHPERLPNLVKKIKTMWLTEPNFTKAELASIRTPTFIMDGQQEEFIRTDHAKEIAAAIPHASLLILPNIGHFAMEETPQAWNESVLQFLQAR